MGGATFTESINGVDPNESWDPCHHLEILLKGQ